MSRNATLDQNQVLFGKNLNYGKVLSGPADITHMTWHLLVLKNTARPLTKAVGSAPSMKHGTVGSRATGKVPSLYDTLKSFSLGLGDDIHHFDILKVIDRQNISAFEIVFALKPDFLSNLLNLYASLRGMSLGAFVYFVGRLPLGIVPDLNGRITICLQSLYLHNGAGACFNNRNGDKVVVAIVNLGHPKLFS